MTSRYVELASELRREANAKTQGGDLVRHLIWVQYQLLRELAARDGQQIPAGHITPDTNRMTLQDLLDAFPGASLRIGPNGRVNDCPAIIIHPFDVDGPTLDFVVRGNDLLLNPQIGELA